MVFLDKKLCLLAFIFLMMLLVGCATTAPKDAPGFNQSKAAPPATNKVLLYVYRAYAEPTAYRVEVKINGQKIIEIPNEAFTYTYLNEGFHKIDIIWPAISAQKDVHFEGKLEGGKTYYYEVKGVSQVTGITGGVVSYKMGSALFQIDNKGAEARIQKCCRYIASKGHSYYAYSLESTSSQSESSSPDAHSSNNDMLANGKLSADEIEKVFSGYTVEGYHHRRNFDFVRFYANDGSLMSKKKGKKLRRGKWRATNEGLCIHWDGKEEKCRPIYNDNGTIRKYVHKKGEKIMVITYNNFIEGNKEGF